MPIARTNPYKTESTQGQVSLPIDKSLAFANQSPDETPQEDKGVEQDFYENLAEKLEDKLLTKIGMTVKQTFDKDLSSRSEWDENIKKGIKNLGIKMEELSDPFEGACSATHPLILEAAVKFQSKATAELLPASGPVRTKVMGLQTDEKIASAKRVKDFLNYQIMDVMTEYVPDMERLLLMLPLMGSAFKKTYWNSGLDRPESCFVSSDNFVINNGARSIEKARRHTEILPSMTGAELRRKITDGDYIEPVNWVKQRSNASQIVEDVTGNTAVGGSGSFYLSDVSKTIESESGFQNIVLGTQDDEKIYTLLEQHCYLSLPTNVGGQPGYTDPYVITVEKDSGAVLAIRRNWRDGDPNKKKRVWYSHYSYIPGMGFYGLGLFHLLGNYQATLTAVIRSLVDAGQFASMQGGFKLKGMRIIGDNGAHSPGEWKDVEGPIQKINEAFFQLPYKDPSVTLFEMLKYLEGRGQQFADSTEQVISDSTNYGPVGTTIALIEASMKLFNAIHKRLHFAQKNDLKILAEINFEYLDDNYPYDVPGGQQNVFKADFNPKSVLVIPVSDPNITSQAHRISLAQTKLQAALQDNRGMHNMKQVFRDFYIAIGEDNIDRILPPDEQAQPLDPLGDIMAMVGGKPIQAFPGQNHKAHVEFKLTWLQDQVVGGASEPMRGFVPQVQANVRQHQVLQFQEQVQGMTQDKAGGAPDPKTIAAIQAQAAKEIKQANEALQAVTMGNDPMHMLAAAEMIKAQAEKQKVDQSKVEKLADLSLQAQELSIKLIEAQAAAKKSGLEIQDKRFEQGLKLIQQAIDNTVKLKQVDIQQQDAETARMAAAKKPSQHD